MCFKKPDAKLENGLRGFHPIAPLRMFSKWCTAVMVELLHEEKEQFEWMSLHVGAESFIDEPVAETSRMAGTST